jgi:hypothetical protein
MSVAQIMPTMKLLCIGSLPFIYHTACWELPSGIFAVNEPQNFLRAGPLRRIQGIELHLLTSAMYSGKLFASHHNGFTSVEQSTASIALESWWGSWSREWSFNYGYPMYNSVSDHIHNLGNKTVGTTNNFYCSNMFGP